MNELDIIKVYADGKTVPEIASGTNIILIQNNIVQVGKLNLGAQYDFNMEIEHPKNQNDLNLIATEIIKDQKPEYLKNANSVIAICPKIISNKMIWE
jgi:hypothetical protein